MTFVQRVPPPPLDASIAAIWYCESELRPHTLERVLPNGCAQLIVNLAEDQTRGYLLDGEELRVVTTSGTVLAGVQSRFSIIDTLEQQCVLGVTFRPGGTLPFFRMPAHELCDVDLPLEFAWGARARSFANSYWRPQDRRRRSMPCSGPSSNNGDRKVFTRRWISQWPAWRGTRGQPVSRT